MRVLVSLSARFVSTPDGRLWSENEGLGHRFWTRYLDVYEEVLVLARAVERPKAPPRWAEVTGPRVKACPVADFRSPWEFARRLPVVRRVARQALLQADAVHLRLPCLLGGFIGNALPPERPYGAEIVGDPYDVFAREGVKHRLRPFFRWWFPRQLRQQCRRACAVAYVTAEALQRRYAPREGTFQTYYSSVDLPREAFVQVPRSQSADTPINIVFVGSLTQLYKAPDVLIDAVSRCVANGLDLRLTLVGDGRYRAELEARVARLGLAGRTRFLGQLPGGRAVRDELDKAHLFVLPSRTEGLPRAMIEAMARGLPCIGSSVGGIPELLPPEDMVPPGDGEALAAKIWEVVTDPDRMARMSARNLAKAREYREEILRERRVAFYKYVRKKTEEWLRSRNA